MSERYDFAVVGSGAGGAAVASRLAEGGGRVLLLEEGPWAQAPADELDAVSRYYVAGGATAAVGRALVPVPIGRAVGGTTKINSGTCLRPPRAMTRRWAEAVPGFDDERFAEYVERAWSALGARRATPGTTSASSRLFLAGLQALRIPGGHLLDRAAHECSGAGRCCFVCPSGAKRSADVAFLERSMEGLRVLAQTNFVGARRASGRWSLRLERAGKTEEAEAAVIVLSAGALRTPWHARRLAPAKAARAGESLSVHPAAKVFAEFDGAVRGRLGVPQGAGLVDPEDPDIRYEGAFTPPGITALSMPLEGRALAEWSGRYDRLAAFGFMIRDEARGRVRYPLGPGLPALSYEPTPADIERLRRAMLFVARVFFAAGARRVLLPLNRPANRFGSLAELQLGAPERLEARDLQTMGFHPLGTCGMGRVVDADLRLDEGLYVCDGSVVPESLGVNPQVTITAFALRLADHLLGGRRAG